MEGGLLPPKDPREGPTLNVLFPSQPTAEPKGKDERGNGPLKTPEEGAPRP